MKDSILKTISSLPPLPESVTKIQQICNDPEGSIADIIKIVEKDPMLTANLLKSANSPLYGFSREITNVSQAVSLFGMATVRGFVLSSAIKNHIPMDISPYGITLTRFAQLSTLQTALMVGWYSKVDRSKLDILSPASFLCEIGKLIIASEVVKEGKKTEFLEKIKSGMNIHDVEMEFVEATSEDVTAKMFNHWKLEMKMVESIANSHNPEGASTDALPYAYALKTIKTAIDINNILSDDSIERAAIVVEDAGLNVDLFIDEAKKLKNRQ